MSVILLLYLFLYIFSFIYILHIIIDILLSFNLRNCSCFRFWVFYLLFYLRNPRRGFFSPFPALYTQHPANLSRRNGRNPLPAAQIILFDYKFFLGHIFFLVNIECVQYRVLKIHQRKDQIIHLGIICQTLVLLGRA